MTNKMSVHIILALIISEASDMFLSLRTSKGCCFLDIWFGFFFRDDWFLVPEVFHYLLSLVFYFYLGLSLETIELFVRTEMKMAKETLIKGHCQGMETCLSKKQNKKKKKKQKKNKKNSMDLTAEEQGKSTTVLTELSHRQTENPERVDREYCSDLSIMRPSGQRYLTAHRYQLNSITLFYEKRCKQQSKALNME